MVDNACSICGGRGGFHSRHSDVVMIGCCLCGGTGTIADASLLRAVFDSVRRNRLEGKAAPDNAAAVFCSDKNSRVPTMSDDDDDDFESAIHKRWESVTNDGAEHCEFERVQNKRCRRPDLHAFLLLADLFPSDSDLISGAGHDEIWLDVDDDQIETLTDDQILELSRCGVRYDESNGCLSMFV